MNSGGLVGKRAAQDQRGVVPAVRGPRGGVEQLGPFIAIARPADGRAAQEPAVGREFLAKLDPVIRRAAADNFEPAQPGRIGVVVRVEPVNPAGADGQSVAGRQPVEVTLVSGVEMIGPRVGRAHGVKDVAIFNAGAGADDA